LKQHKIGIFFVLAGIPEKKKNRQSAPF